MRGMDRAVADLKAEGVVPPQNAIPIKAMVDPDAVFLDNLADGIHEALEEMKREGIPLPPRPLRNPALDRLRAEDEARAKRR